MIRFVPKGRIEEVTKEGKPQKGDKGQAKKTIARDKAAKKHVSLRTAEHQARRGVSPRGAGDTGPTSGSTQGMKPDAGRMIAALKAKQQARQQRSSTELDRIGVAILEGLGGRVEESNRARRAAKRAMFDPKTVEAGKKLDSEGKVSAKRVKKAKVAQKAGEGIKTDDEGTVLGTHRPRNRPATRMSGFYKHVARQAGKGNK